MARAPIEHPAFERDNLVRRLGNVRTQIATLENLLSIEREKEADLLEMIEGKDEIIKARPKPPGGGPPPGGGRP